MYRLAVLVLLVASRSAFGQTLASDFQANYTVTNLGPVTGLPAVYGGITLKSGDPNTLLIAANANATNGAIFAVPVTRGAGGHVTGFGTPTAFASAPRIDGGLTYHPTANVLFATTFEDAPKLFQYRPGSTAPDKTINLGSLGVSGSTGSVSFVPAGFGGGGKLVLTSFTMSRVYTADVTADGAGLFTVSNVQSRGTLTDPIDPEFPVGPEAVSWVDGRSPAFDRPTVLVNEYSTGQISGYNWDAATDDIDETSRYAFLTGLNGPIGSFTDPATGDLLLTDSFNGQDTIYRVSGFVPVPEPVGLLVAGGIMALATSGGRRCWTSGKRSSGRSSTRRTTTRRGWCSPTGWTNRGSMGWPA